MQHFCLRAKIRAHKNKHGKKDTSSIRKNIIKQNFKDDGVKDENIF